MNKNLVKMLMVAAFITTALCGMSANSNSFADPKKAPAKSGIVGTWQYCNNDTIPVTSFLGQEGILHFKIFTEETFTVVDVKKGTNTFAGFLMGTYNIANNVLTESIQYSNPGIVRLIGQTNAFTFKIKNNILILKYVTSGNVEIWKKIKD